MSKQATHPRIAPLQPPYTAEIDALLKKWMPPGAASEPLRLDVAERSQRSPGRAARGRDRRAGLGRWLPPDR